MKKVLVDEKRYCCLYLVRHGETDWNVKGLLQGHQDTLLNKTGKKQAVETRKILNKIKFAKVFSSDLLRAKETAEIIVLKKKIAVETTKALRERYFGRFEGIHWQKNKEYQKLISKFYKLSEEERYKGKPYEDTESNEELVGRFIPFLREVAVAYPGKNILVVGHGGVMRAFLTHLGYFKTLPPGSIKNTAYVKVLCDGVDFFIEKTYGIGTPVQLINRAKSL